MILADLHIHSTFSDGEMTIPEITDFYGTRGFGAIAVTDHLCEKRSFLGRGARVINNTLTEATFPLYVKILESEAKRAWETYGMLIIPGIELTKNSLSNHRSAHILALGITEWLGADGDVLDLAREIRKRGALSIAAHPVHTRKMEKQTYHLWNRREELKHYIDAWEVASGPNLFEEVLESGLPIVASSDLHRRKQINSWKTLLFCEPTQESVFNAIRNQNLKPVFFTEKEELSDVITGDAFDGDIVADRFRHTLDLSQTG